jgi:hypothetical protein
MLNITVERLLHRLKFDMINVVLRGCDCLGTMCWIPVPEVFGFEAIWITCGYLHIGYLRQSQNTVITYDVSPLFRTHISL